MKPFFVLTLGFAEDFIHGFAVNFICEANFIRKANFIHLRWISFTAITPTTVTDGPP